MFYLMINLIKKMYGNMALDIRYGPLKYGETKPITTISRTTHSN